MTQLLEGVEAQMTTCYLIAKTGIVALALAACGAASTPLTSDQCDRALAALRVASDSMDRLSTGRGIGTPEWSKAYENLPSAIETFRSLSAESAGKTRSDFDKTVDWLAKANDKLQRGDRPSAPERDDFLAWWAPCQSIVSP